MSRLLTKIVIFSYFKYALILLLGLFLLISFGQGLNAQSSDAVAIRVLSNPDHFSAGRWYKEQGFTGSPQSVTVDGYSGIRDGRTVYVNAANLTGTELYTNIYIISYNQDAERETTDIFSHIIANWKFNTNLPMLVLAK